MGYQPLNSTRMSKFQFRGYENRKWGTAAHVIRGVETFPPDEVYPTPPTFTAFCGNFAQKPDVRAVETYEICRNCNAAIKKLNKELESVK